MFQRHLARDRFVMIGLIVLGLLMVAAGVVSGRSSFEYVLAEDARAAADNWVQAAEARRGAQADYLDADAVLCPSADSAPGDVGGSAELDSHVARISGLALFDAGRAPLLAAAGAAPERLDRLQADAAFAEAFDAALDSGETQVLRLSVPRASRERNGTRLVLVPVREGGNVSRVYAVEADQASTERMTDVVLTAASAATSLLIVMGFVVPAAIAARRIRERWMAEDELRFLALHDSLTGLPNRVQLRERVEQAAARAKRRGCIIAVLGLDLDRFKDINDTLGHAIGDALLEEVAVRLKQCVRDTDMVARLGGDEFAIVAEDMESPEDATRLAARVRTALCEPYEVGGHEFANSVSIGIALGPVEGDNRDTLLKNADLALYRAKRDGRNTYRFFEPEMDAALQERRRLERDLRAAVHNGELELHYQPQYELKSGQVTGYEALLRWRHPVRGEIQPGAFIPVAEETGLIASIGEWVLRTACAYAATWPEHLSLAVNLSPAQFKAQDVVAIVTRILKETGFPANRLELEITESLLLHNTDAVVETLKRLDAAGVRIAMDDFGTGYSSLSYLTRCPVRKIKIDSFFIDALGAESEHMAIVSSIVGLGQSLNVTITAEGVNTTDQADILRAWGCDHVQGFLYGKPSARIVPGGETRTGVEDGTAEAEPAAGRAADDLRVA